MTATPIPLDVQVRQAHRDALAMMLPGTGYDAARQTMGHARLNIYRRAVEARAYASVEKRIRDLHRPVDRRGMTICGACSDYGQSTDSTDSRPVPYDQCSTIAALNNPTEPTP